MVQVMLVGRGMMARASKIEEGFIKELSCNCFWPDDKSDPPPGRPRTIAYELWRFLNSIDLIHKTPVGL